MEIKAMLFAPDVVCQRLYPLLSDDEIKVIGKISNENKVLDEISRVKPDIVLISADNMNVLLRTCHQIYLLRPRSIPVVLIDEQNPEKLQRIIQTGVHYILPLSIDNYTLVSQLKGIYTNESSRLSALENTSSHSWKSKVIMVFGTTGGTGKTSLAANLAVKLEQKKRKVALLDFSLQFGDANVHLGIDSKNTIGELLQEQSSPNVDSIRRYLEMHSSGINVLCAPSSPEYADNISSLQTDKIISALRAYYDYVIVDTAPEFNPVNLSCFDAASVILFVTGMDIAALRRTKKGLSVAHSLLGPEKIKLVIGKEHGGRVKLKDVARALEFPVWASIPYDSKVAIEAINYGRPAVLSAPSSAMSKMYDKIASQIDATTSDGERTVDKKPLRRLSSLFTKTK